MAEEFLDRPIAGYFYDHDTDLWMRNDYDKYLAGFWFYRDTIKTTYGYNYECGSAFEIPYRLLNSPDEDIVKWIVSTLPKNANTWNFEELDEESGEIDKLIYLELFKKGITKRDDLDQEVQNGR